MHESDLVSVIIPVYNVEAFLDRCVISVINQTYTNLEIILVDDGATDSSPELCDRWAKKDHRITVVHKANGGLSSARNAGIAVSHAPWIAFIDSDDWVEPDYVSTLHDLAVSNNADLAICSLYDYRTPDHMLDPLKDEVLTGRDLFVKATQTENWRYQVAWNKLYARRLCPSTLFAEGKLHEDIFSFPIISLSAETVAVTSTPLYHYMVNEGGIMHARYSIRNLDVIEALIDQLNAAINHSIPVCYHPITASIRSNIVDKAASELPLFTDRKARKRLLGLVDDYISSINHIGSLGDRKLDTFNMQITKHPMRLLIFIHSLSLMRRIARKIKHVLSH